MSFGHPYFLHYEPNADLLCLKLVYEIFFWGSIQATNLDTLYQFTVVDAIVSIPAGLLAAIVQAYFAERAWRVSLRSGATSAQGIELPNCCLAGCTQKQNLHSGCCSRLARCIGGLFSSRYRIPYVKAVIIASSASTS